MKFSRLLAGVCMISSLYAANSINTMSPIPKISPVQKMSKPCIIAKTSKKNCILNIEAVGKGVPPCNGAYN